MQWEMVLAASLIAVPVVVLAGFRVRTGPNPWTPIDVAIALTLVVWIGAVASGVAFLTLAGSGERVSDMLEGSAGTSLLLGILAANLFGVGSAALFARLRAGPGALGFDLTRPVWLIWAVVLMLPLSIVWFGWGGLLELLGVPLEPQLLTTLLQGAPSSALWVGALVYVIAIVPALEEMVFRGFVQAPFVRRWGRWPGIATSSALFAFAHLTDPQAIPPLLVLGMVLGWLRERTGSLAAPTALHAANNAAALAVTLWI
jgi:membrane protease YdiL (CAAX protease family)